MIRLVFSNETKERLRHERIHHPHPRARQRLEAHYLKSAGWLHQATCTSLGITKPTLIGYLRLYQTGARGYASVTSPVSHGPHNGSLSVARLLMFEISDFPFLLCGNLSFFITRITILCLAEKMPHCNQANESEIALR